MIDPQDLLQVAVGAAREAGALIEEMAAAGINAKDKGFRDVVTEADLASQKLITAYVLARFPNHAFLAEEEDAELPDSASTIWIIDPIDGTSNYSRQLPAYCVSIGVAIEGEIVAGVVFDPKSGDLFAASKGNGATLNDQPLQVSQIDTLDDAIVLHDWSRPADLRTSINNILGTVIHNARTVRAIGSAALAICWVAAGKADCYFNIHLGAWDWAGATIILTEAGGQLTAFDGSSLTPSPGIISAAASNTLLHSQLLNHLT